MKQYIYMYILYVFNNNIQRLYPHCHPVSLQQTGSLPTACAFVFTDGVTTSRVPPTISSAFGWDHATTILHWMLDASRLNSRSSGMIARWSWLSITQTLLLSNALCCHFSSCQPSPRLCRLGAMTTSHWCLLPLCHKEANFSANFSSQWLPTGNGDSELLPSLIPEPASCFHAGFFRL